MKLTFQRQGRPDANEIPMPGGQSRTVEVPGETCWGCKKPLVVAGKCPKETDRDVTSRADCSECGETAGTLVVHFNTLFGREEDERVLHGPWKTYV